MSISITAYLGMFIAWIITFICLVKSWKRIEGLSSINESLYASIRQIRSELSEKNRNIESLSAANESYLEKIKELTHDADN